MVQLAVHEKIVNSNFLNVPVYYCVINNDVINDAYFVL